MTSAIKWNRLADRSTGNTKYESTDGRFEVVFNPRGWIVIDSGITRSGQYESATAAKKIASEIDQTERDEYAKTGIVSDQRAAVVGLWAQKIQAYALKNYDQSGWDYIVECFERRDIADTVLWETTYAAALRLMRQIAECHHDRECDIRNA